MIVAELMDYSYIHNHREGVNQVSSIMIGQINNIMNVEVSHHKLIMGHKKLNKILFKHLCKYSCTFLSYKTLISKIRQMHVEQELLDKH